MHHGFWFFFGEGGVEKSRMGVVCVLLFKVVLIKVVIKSKAASSDQSNFL